MVGRLLSPTFKLECVAVKVASVGRGSLEMSQLAWLADGWGQRRG